MIIENSGLNDLKSELGYTVEQLADIACISLSDYMRLFENNVIKLRVLN